MNNERLAHVRANLRRHGLSQMLLVDPLSIWWLCGYYTEPYERFLALYVPCDEAKEPVMFSNRLFPEVGDACADVRTFDDTEDPIALVRDVTDRAAALGVDKKLAARWLVPLMEAGAATGFALASDAIDDARSTKDAHERELMRAASAVNDQAMDWLAGQIRPGVTERQIADGLLGEYRRLGAQDAMENAGLTFDDKLYGLSNYDFESAYHAMNSLLARRAEFTALFAMSDVIAFGAIRALVSAGFRVPEDVSVIGFDGITMSRYCVPVMTTIVQPSEQIALQSIELLVRQIEHGAPAQTVTLQPELQQGESVCPCRRNDSV